MESTIWDFGINIFDGGFLYFIIRSLIIFLVAKIIVKILRKLFKKYEMKSDFSDMSVEFIKKIVCAAVYIIAIFVILAGIKPLAGLGTAVLGATSVISVVLGLAAQETFGNLIAGFFLAMNHPFEVGDLVYLKDKDISGKVMQITFRQTEIQTAENTKVIIPNSLINTTIVENREYGQGSYTKYMSFEIGYDSDFELAKELIFQAVLSTEGIIDTRSEEEKSENKDPFIVRIEEYDASGVKLVFPLQCDKFSSSFNLASEVRSKLLKSFKENNIEIPYTIVEVINKK